MSSNIIEQIGRSAKDALVGVKDVTTGSDVTTQNQRGANLVSSMATGGMALGAGASAVVALINYLKNLHDEEELEDESRLNDDTLYIASAPEKKAAAGPPPEINRWVAPGLAITGGILSAGGAYALTQAVYNYLQKKRKQKLLDEAQGEALAAADLEVYKSAATDDAKMNLYDLLLGAPVAIPLLAALASGGVTFAALRKTFPTVKPPKSPFPKRIRQAVKKDSGEQEVEEDVGVAKSAAVRLSDTDCEAAACEFLMLTVDSMSSVKSAEHRITSDLISKAAKEGLDSLVQVQKDGGIEALVEFVKDASATCDLTQAQKVAVVATLCKSARIYPIASIIAASEFRELAPDLTSELFYRDTEQIEKMAGLAPLLHFVLFRPLLNEKSAASMDILEELKDLLVKDPNLSDESFAELTSDSVGVLSDDAEGGDIQAEADEELDKESDDVVDQFLDSDKMIVPTTTSETEID